MPLQWLAKLLGEALSQKKAKVKGQDLAFVVDAWRKGKVSKLPKVVQQKMNTLEYFVHYVDVVAANPDKFAETAVLRLHDNDRLELMAHARSMAAMLLRGSTSDSCCLWVAAMLASSLTMS